MIRSILRTQTRCYVSRAHPRPVPEFALPQALEEVLKTATQRQKRRENRFQKQKDTATTKARPDETIEIALNLNLDPRKPGQALRGSVELPHGTGKTVSCAVFTTDEDLVEQAKQAGALAGGESLVDEIANGLPINFSTALATAEMMPILSRKVARILGPRGLMPNVKVGTLVPPEELIATLKSQLAGTQASYRTEKEGIIHVAVGKASFDLDKIVENIGEVMKEIFAAKPEQYGKGKKGMKAKTGKAAKYLLKASVSSTQGKGVRLDLKTIDPNSVFFLTTLGTPGGNQDDDQQAA
jgi:large subunit ribosomal protein L1